MSNSTYLQLTKEELQLISAALTIGSSQPFKDLKDKVDLRISEMDDRTLQARYQAYRDNVDVNGGEIEDDADALVSESDDGGAYVMTWSWVSDWDAGICIECGATNADNGEGFAGLCGECADKAEEAEDV